MDLSTAALFTQAAFPNTDASTKEQDVNEVIAEALNVAAPFIPGGPVATKVVALTGLAPAAVHLGFLFAHLFSHPKIQAAMQAPAPPAPDPAIAAAAAADAEKQKQKDAAVKAIEDQMTELKGKLAALQSN